MKDLGIVRNLDELGRITLPVEIRRSLGIELKEKAPFRMFVDEDAIVLKKANVTTKDTIRQLYNDMDKLKSLDNQVVMEIQDLLMKFEEKVRD